MENKLPDGSIVTKEDGVDRCAWCNLPMEGIASPQEHIDYHVGRDKEVAKRKAKKLKNKKKE